MTSPTRLLGLGLALVISAAHGQSLDSAEVRLPYGELKRLLARADAPTPPAAMRPAVLGIRLKFVLDHDRPLIEADIKVAAFSSEPALVPLIAGEVAMVAQDPQDATVVADANGLALAVDARGTRGLRLRLLPVLNQNRFSIQLPTCPSVIIENAMPGDRAVILGEGENAGSLEPGQSRPWVGNGKAIAIRVPDAAESRELLKPLAPSTWTWQHEALVQPTDDGLIYQVRATAKASDGSGMDALLPLPADAQEVTVGAGEDLLDSASVRVNGRPELRLRWQTRGILERRVILSYRMPLRPLDRSWHLEAPVGEGTRTRFLIASSPRLAYAAEGLSERVAATAVPKVFAESLQGGTCYILEAGRAAELKITPIPVAAIASGVVTQADWSLKIEADGAMLATGIMTIAHKENLEFSWDTPPGMKLLACEVDGHAYAPVDLGDGRLQVSLPPGADGSRLSCSFTGRTQALDPVEGTLRVALPKLPMFIHVLNWRIDLPDGYQTETFGNLTRSNSNAGAPASPNRLLLIKKSSRDERPETQLFYQRAQLNL